MLFWRKKEKTTGWEGGFTNKTVWTYLYAYYLYNNFLFVCLFFGRFLVKILFLEFTIVFVHLMKIKIKFIKKYIYIYSS